MDIDNLIDNIENLSLNHINLADFSSIGIINSYDYSDYYISDKKIIINVPKYDKVLSVVTDYYKLKLVLPYITQFLLISVNIQEDYDNRDTENTVLTSLFVEPDNANKDIIRIEFIDDAITNSINSYDEAVELFSNDYEYNIEFLFDQENQIKYGFKWNYIEAMLINT
jgi:hypothetical protein